VTSLDWKEDWNIVNPGLNPSPWNIVKPLALEHSKPLALEQSKPLALEHSKPLALEQSKPLALEHSKPLAFDNVIRSHYYTADPVPNPTLVIGT